MRAVKTIETQRVVKDFIALAYGYRAIARQEGITDKKRAQAYFKAHACLKAARELLN